MDLCLDQEKLAWAQTSVDQASRAYHIPPGPLDQALRSFTQASGVHLAYDPSLVKGKTTSGLSGTYSAEQALSQLLAGSGLQPVAGESGAITLAAQKSTSGGKDTVTLPEVTVQDQQQSPPGSYEITGEVLRRTMAEDMADVFETDSSVNIGGGGRNAQRLYLRGIEGTNLNITIDGARQGQSLHQHAGDLGGIDPWLLKRVEVQPGPGGADQGPGSLGGAIAFETVDAQDLLTPGKDLGATIRATYGSVNDSWLGGAAAYGRYEGNFGLLASASGVDQDDYAIGDDGGDAPNTAGQSRDYFMKFSMLDYRDHTLRLSAERNTYSGHYIWGSTGSDMGYPLDTSEAVYAETERDTYVLNHRYNPGSKLLDTKLNLYLNQNSIDNQTSGTKYISETWGGDASNTFTFDLGPTVHHVSVGLDFIAADNKAEISGSGDRSNQSSNLGVFIQDRMTMGPLGLSFGARLDNYDADYGPNSISGSEVSPNINATYELLQGLTAFAGYAQAVRGTGIIPGSWMSNIDSDTTFDVGEPESSQQIDGGLRYIINDLFLGHDQLQLEGTLFQTKLENTIEANGRRGIITSIENGETIYSRGYELRLAWRVDAFQTSLGFTHVDTEDADGNPLGVVRRKAASAGDRLVWDNSWRPIEGVTLGYTLIAVGRLTDVPEGYPERPGYMLNNIQAAWTPSFLPNLSLSLAVNNLFDVRYSDQTTIYSDETGLVEEPGRDIRLGFTYRF